jgi:type II secretory pathway pseudopilin PulG
MPARAEDRDRSGDAGFTLVEAAMAILVVAILAGALAPLANKVLNQQREERTRVLLKQAFEGCFGARERRVANLRADFGFDPSSSLTALPILVSRAGTSWSGTPTYSNASGFMCGYNGPYWSGPLDGTNAPLDGWGNPIRLLVSAGGYQTQSAGVDRIYDSADDIYYPTVAVPYLTFNATVTLQISRASANITGNATLSFLYGTSPSSTTRCTPNLVSAPAIGALAAPARAIANTGIQTLQWNVPAGACYLQLAQTTGSFTSVNLALDLMPGENRSISLTL